MIHADTLTIDCHDGYRWEFAEVDYTLEQDWVRVRGTDGAHLLLVSAFDIADLQAVRKGQRR